MKKLLVTAIGAAAALGASAGLISTQRFENVTGELPQAATISSLNELAGGNFWSGDELTNTYTYISCAGEAFPQDKPLGPATKALEVKTTFGSPLTVKAIAGDNTSTNIPASGIYFDSLVKFTVCEEAPEQTYDGAKIIMWLEEEYASDGDTILGTNIMVRASYVNANGTCTPTNFVCKRFSLNIDDWHRVTIKTLPNIVNGNDIPGFVIFLNGSAINLQSGGTMASEIAASLTEAAEKDGDGNPLGASKVFASLVQGNAAGKSTITSASFDGTGKLTDLVFTDVAPFDAAENWVEPQAAVTIGGNPVSGIKTLAQAVAVVNGASAGSAVEFTLGKTMEISEPLVFNSEADVVLDFHGCVLTNTAATAAIENSGASLTLTNSVGNGGICCASTGVALNLVDGELFVAGGNYWTGDADLYQIASGYIGESKFISGGAVVSDMVVASANLAEGKIVSDVADVATGLYPIVDYVPPTFTATFVTYDGSVFDQQANITSNTLATAPGIAPTRDHYTFTGWAPAVADTPIVSNTTFTATWTVDSYTVKFVYGLQGEKEYSQSYNYGLSPELPGDATETGYNLTWKPTVGTVESNTTYTANYEAQSYTITFNANGGTVDPATTNYTIVSGEITLPNAVPTSQMTGVQFAGWTNDTYTVATNKFTPSAANLADFTLFAKWDATGTASFDGGDGNQFDIAPGAQATVAAKTGHALTDTVTGTTMTYAQAYALGLIDEETGAVADLDATIEIKDGKVVVGLSSTPLDYVITLKVYEKSSLTAESWTLKATYTLNSETATTGFAPSAGTSNFYKTEVTISNK